MTAPDALAVGPAFDSVNYQILTSNYCLCGGEVGCGAVAGV